MAVMQSPTDEERERGIHEIDLHELRRPGTGIYVVVPEGDATRYRIALSILFGLASSVVRKTSNDERGAPVLLALDEAGNIPLHNLSEALGVGRGRRCGIVLGYQNIGQLYKQHGRDGAQAILGSIGTMVFLPGIDSETAQYAARRIGRTTVLHTRLSMQPASSLTTSANPRPGAICSTRRSCGRCLNTRRRWPSSAPRHPSSSAFHPVAKRVNSRIHCRARSHKPCRSRKLKRQGEEWKSAVLTDIHMKIFAWRAFSHPILCSSPK
jgi:hypothetical protein